MFTGYSAPELEYELGPEERILPGQTVWHDLSEMGYSTALFSTNANLGEQFGISSDFDRVVQNPLGQQLPYQEALNPLEMDDTGFEEVLKKVMKNPSRAKSLINAASLKLRPNYPFWFPEFWRVTRREETRTLFEIFQTWREEIEGPSAAFFNLMDAHGLYEPTDDLTWIDSKLVDLHEEWFSVDQHERAVQEDNWWPLEAFELLYESAIRRVDRLVGEFIRTLEKRGDLEDNFLLITADHGEGFGEPSRVVPNHHIYGHMASTHEVSSHVPLIVSPPEEQYSGTGSIEEPASLVKLPDALRSAANEEWKPKTFTQEQVIVSVIEAEEKKRILDQENNNKFIHNSRPVAVYEENNKGITKYTTWGDYQSKERVYNPQETRKISDSQGSDRVEEVLCTLNTHTLSQNTVALDSQTIQRLEDLGYK